MSYFVRQARKLCSLNEYGQKVLTPYSSGTEKKILTSYMGRISIWEAQIDMGGSLTSGKNSTTVVSTTEGYGIKSGLSQNVNMVFAKPISSSSASLSRYISIGKLHAYYAQNSIIGNDFASIFIILCHTKSFSQELKVFIETDSRNEFIDRKKKEIRVPTVPFTSLSV